VFVCLYQGGWVLLQNCHLGLNFLDELLDTVTNTDNIHDSCRVWITTEVHLKFPISLLQVPPVRRVGGALEWWWFEDRAISKAHAKSHKSMPRTQ